MTEYVSPLDPRTRGDDPLAPRPASLEGRRVALLDISKNRGAEFLDRVESGLQALGATTERFAKPLFSRAASAGARLLSRARFRAQERSTRALPRTIRFFAN